MNIGDLVLRLLADGSKLQSSVVKEAGKAGDAGAQTLGQRLTKGLSPEKVGTAIGAAFGGIAAAGVRMGDKVDAALDSIRVGTGATGEALAGLESDFKAVASRVPDDLETVGQVIADLNTRTGQTGKGLQDLATTILDFSRITKSDVNTNVRNATRLFGDWSIATEDQAATLDKVYRASQATGIGVESLMETVVSFGSPMRLLGFSFEESIALLSKWEKEGVNTETALAGLKFGVKTLAKDGIAAADMGEELRKRLDAIRTSADPVTDSIKLFGLRAGPDLAAAIVEGRFATEDLLEVINNGTDTIAAATAETQDLGDALAKASNWIQSNLGGLFTAFAGLGNLVYLFPVIGGAFGKMAGRIIGSAGGLRSALETLYLKGLYAADAAKGIASRIATAIGSSRIVTAISDGLSGALAKVPGSAKFGAAAGKLGDFMGSKLGKGLSIAFAAIAVVEVIKTYNEVKDQLDSQTARIGEELGKQIATGTTAGLEQSKAALEKGIADLGELWYNPFAGDQKRKLEEQLAAVTAELERRGRDIPGALAAGIDAGRPLAENAGTAMVAGAEGAISGRVRGGSWGEEGQKIPEEIGAGILRRQAVVTDAVERLKYLMANVLSRSKQIARDIGILTSDELAKGLEDKRPAVRRQAELVQSQTEAELVKLIAKGGKAGEKAMERLERMLNSKRPTVRAAAQRVKDGVAAELAKTAAPAGAAGAAAGQAFISRLKAAVSSGDFTVNAFVGFTVPGKAKGGPVAAGQPYVVGERGPEIFVPEASGTILTHAETVKAQGSGGAAPAAATYNIPVTVQGALPVRTIADIQREMVRAGDLGQMPPRRLSPLYPRKEAAAPS